MGLEGRLEPAQPSRWCILGLQNPGSIFLHVWSFYSPKAILAMYSLDREGWEWHLQVGLEIENPSLLYALPRPLCPISLPALERGSSGFDFVRAGLLCCIDICFISVLSLCMYP